MKYNISNFFSAIKIKEAIISKKRIPPEATTLVQFLKPSIFQIKNTKVNIAGNKCLHFENMQYRERKNSAKSNTVEKFSQYGAAYILNKTFWNLKVNLHNDMLIKNHSEQRRSLLRYAIH